MPSQPIIDESKSHEESGLNNNFEISVFEKLKTLISAREANNYKSVCEIFNDEFFENGLFTYYEESLCETQVFLTGWIVKRQRSPDEVLILVKHIFQIVLDKEESPQKVAYNKLNHINNFIVDENEICSSQYIRSWVVLATLMSLSQIPNLIIEGIWESVLYELLKYIKMWDMDSKFSIYSLSHRTASTLKNNFCWEWIIETMCSAIICPSPYLRLEIFRLIHLFDPDKKIFSNGMKIVTAYVECMSSINPEQLFVTMGINLLSMQHLMLRICTLSLPWRLKHLISGKVVKDLHQNHIGKEVRFVANSLIVIGMFAHITKTRYKAGSKYLRRSLNLCMYLFMFGHNNDFSENIYNHKLLLPYTCCALADITDGILTLSASMNDSKSESERVRKKRMSLYNKIVKRRNDLVDDLEIPKSHFMHVNLCQREQSSHKFSNILFIKKTSLALPKLELGTICSDDIEPMSYYHNDEDDDSQVDSDTESDVSDGSSFSDGPMFPLDGHNTSSSDSNNHTRHSSVSENNFDYESSSSGSRNDTASIYSLTTDNESS